MVHRFLIFLCCLSRLSAQETATAVFDSAVVETGEAFALHLAANSAPDTINFTAWDSLLPENQIIKRSGWYQKGNTWIADLTWIAFDEGILHLPPLPIKLKNGGTAITNPSHLTIIATPVASTDPNDIADIKDIHREVINWTDRIWIAWLFGGLAILGLLLYWIFLHQKKRPPARKMHSATYRDTALQKLQQLEKQELWQNRQTKTYYANLSFIVREFIGQHLHIKALEGSTADLIKQISSMDASTELKEAVITLLDNADLVKFAKGLPETEYHPQAIADARRFILSFQTR